MLDALGDEVMDGDERQCENRHQARDELTEDARGQDSLMAFAELLRLWHSDCYIVGNLKVFFKMPHEYKFAFDSPAHETVSNGHTVTVNVLVAAQLVLFIGLPLTGQTPPPVWTVQSTSEITEVNNPVPVIVGPGGEVYIAGPSNSFDWPAPANTVGDISKFPLFVSKLDSSGRPIYTTAIGGASGASANRSLMLDGVGGLYVHGLAGGGTFGTTPGAYRSTSALASGNGFVCKLRAADGVILFCALLDEQSISAFTVDSAGSIYLAAGASKLLDPTPGAFTFGNRMIDVTKVDAAGATIVWRAEFDGSTLGGAPSSLAIDPLGNVWMAGTANSFALPITADALISVFPQASASTGFLARLNPSGTSLLYATYTSPVMETLTSMSLDSLGNIYTLNSRNSVPLVRKFSSDGKSVLYERSFPGMNTFGAEAEVDALGFVTLLGNTQNVNFATYRSVQSCNLTELPAGLTDGVLARLGPDGTLLESTFLGLNAPISFNTQTLFVQTSKSYAIVWSNPSKVLFPGDSFVGPFQIELRQFEPDANAGNGPKLACVGSAATLTGAPLANGEIVSLFGTGFGPKSPPIGQPGSDNRFPTVLGGTQVTFDGVSAPLLYASDTQINAIVPWNSAGSAGPKVCVSFQAAKTNCILAERTNFAPGIFQQASGYAAVINQDGTVNSPDNPAHGGSTIYIYATGLGSVSPTPADGSIAPFPAPTTSAPIEVTFIRGLAERQGEVLRAGLAPLEVAGLFEIDVKIPALPPLMPEPVPTDPNAVQRWTIGILVDLPGGPIIASPGLPISLVP